MARLLVPNADNEFVARLVVSLSTKHGVAVEALGAVPGAFTDSAPTVVEVSHPGEQSHALLTIPTGDDAVDRCRAFLDDLPPGMAVVLVADELDSRQAEVGDYVRQCGNPWTVLRPVAMMDFSFAALPPQVSMAGAVFGISGYSKVGFVAASDVMRAIAAIVTEGGHSEAEYVLTGPSAEDMPTVVATLSSTLGWGLDYIDLTDEELRTLMVQYGRQEPELIDRVVLGQLRAWRDGRCDTVTSAVEQITGTAAMTVGDWFAAHRDDFPRSQTLAQRTAGRLVRARYRNRVLAPAD